MTTITIPKNLMAEKDLMIIPRSEYQNLLKHKVMNEEYESLLQKASKDKLLKSYNKSDAVYDQI
jgi:hypothetical protein